MKKINAVLVDDEKMARDVLRNYLTKYCPTVERLGEAKNINEAVPLIENTQPELVFLDVEMPFGNAFDVLEQTQHLQFETIFITAFSEYALKALNLSAAYYILKPIEIEELIKAVNKVTEVIQEKRQFNRNEILIENLKSSPDQQQIILPTQTGFDVQKIEEITRLQANGNFTDIHLINGSKKLVCRFLKYFQENLPEKFIRVHRSHMINADFIKSYHKGSGGTLTMLDDYEVEVSTSYKQNLIQFFG